MRIAHISDLHFAQIDYGVGQFFSKAWLGNLNLLIRRYKTFCNLRPFLLIPELKKRGIEMCLITGDFTSTGSRAEYEMGRKFVKELDQAKIRWMAIPGNHDMYTKKNEKEKTFYSIFPNRYGESAFSLDKNRCTAAPLTDGWWVLALDTTLATSLISSEGLFSEALENELPKILSTIPENQKILMMNHFPFFQHEQKRRLMRRGKALQHFLEHNPRVQLYLHGHTHRLCLADLRPSQLPIILDSGSAAHHHLSSWNMIDLNQERCDIEVFHWNTSGWHSIKKAGFTW